MIDKLTVGIVAKLTVHVGYILVDRATGEPISQMMVFKNRDTVVPWIGSNGNLDVKPVYIEQD